MPPRSRLLTAAFLSLGVVGCASTGAPNQKSEQSSAAIRAAEEVGATKIPEAALHLQLAKEEYEYAQQLPNPHDRPHADRLLLRAQVDAELALALARSADEKAEALTALDKLRTLKQSTQ